MISRLYKSESKDRLIDLLYKFVRRTYSKLALIKLLDKRLDDKELLRIFSVSNRKSGSNSGVNQYRADKRHQEVLDILQISNLSVAGAYLDIGCADCEITRTLGAFLGFEEVHGTDIIEDPNPDFGVQYFRNSGDLRKYEDSKFGFVTAFQTLHHIPDTEKMIREITRITAPGAVVLIREHNMIPPIVPDLLAVEHMMCDVLFSGMSLEDHCRTYYAKYRTLAEWDYLFSSGFKPIAYDDTFTRYNPTGYFYRTFLKL